MYTFSYFSPCGFVKNFLSFFMLSIELQDYCFTFTVYMLTFSLIVCVIFSILTYFVICIPILSFAGITRGGDLDSYI